MKIIKSLEKGESKHKSVVTIGTFDGVHIGHQKIVKRLINTAKSHDLKSVILTFFPHPRMVIQKDANIKLLNTLKERETILENLGLDILFIKNFTVEFSRLTAEDFVKNILVDQLQAQKIIIGYDHHFGRNRSANIDDLRTFGEHYNFDVEEISAQDINDVSVSSTKIRHALQEGDIKTANLYLGYNYMLTGTVVKGRGLGKELEFPTANLHIDEDYKLIPKQGVYVVSCLFEEKRLYGMMNIGTNPTIDNTNDLSIEVHFFDFNKSIYNNIIQIDILHRLRDEKKFDSLESLKNQLKLDRKTALVFLESYEH
ncbi:riboflavin biosynthesis protein RibF [Hanstruepera neustonica]|uniref:Riboflavin biosynthesis protein n=1 Tax=Hanstruepera neustonica TaxID=1445657 RepID=A0A2K1E2V0_9FLAO|nr:bifunctional riboflavin kinase/FAD synthetase [Hanstruepera neustonica]PNQ74583.1 riboflavin biosynthesis protein RibF [Hanstruepera neustonica]